MQKVNAPANSVSHWIFLLFSILPWAFRKPTSVDYFRQDRFPLDSHGIWLGQKGSRRLKVGEREIQVLFLPPSLLLRELAVAALLSGKLQQSIDSEKGRSLVRWLNAYRKLAVFLTSLISTE